MELIKDLGMRRTNNRSYKYGLFLCLYCNKEVVKPYYGGLKYKSCGCSMYRISSESLTIHGDCKRSLKDKNGNREVNRLYKIYNAIKSRCYNINNPNYNLYGGRGIKMCDIWKKNYIIFKIWALMHGYKDSLSIDRIKNNKGYYPENCHWATQAQQVQNSSKAKLTWPKIHIIRQIIHNKLCSIKELATVYNVSKSQIQKIVNNSSWKEEIIYNGI